MMVQLLVTDLLGLLAHPNKQDATYGVDSKWGQKEIRVCGTRKQSLKETTFRQQFYLAQYLTNLMNQISYHNKFYFMPLHVPSTCAYHQEVKVALHNLWYHHTYRCDDTRGCIMQLWSPGDEYRCSKHVEACNKTYCETKFGASSWLNTEINILRCTVSKTSEQVYYHFIMTIWILYIVTENCTFDTYDYYKNILLLFVLTTAITPKHVVAY
jgi:hypothetical protein